MEAADKQRLVTGGYRVHLLAVSTARDVRGLLDFSPGVGVISEKMNKPAFPVSGDTVSVMLTLLLLLGRQARIRQVGVCWAVRPGRASVAEIISSGTAWREERQRVGTALGERLRSQSSSDGLSRGSLTRQARLQRTKVRRLERCEVIISLLRLGLPTFLESASAI